MIWHWQHIFLRHLYRSSIYSFYTLHIWRFPTVWAPLSADFPFLSLTHCSPCVGIEVHAGVCWGSGEGKDRLELWVMESTMKDLRDGATVLDPKSYACGGVEDVYGEDRATEDQLVTPWTISVARSISPSFPWFFWTQLLFEVSIVLCLYDL